MLTSGAVYVSAPNSTLTRERPVSASESDRGEGTAARPKFALLWIVIVCLVVYNANCRLIAAGDSRPARLLPFAILTRHTVLLDQFGPAPAGSHWFAHTREGHLVSLYPVVLPVLVTPLFIPAAIYVAAANPDPSRFQTLSELMEKSSASVVATLSVVLVWLTLRRLTRERSIAIVLAGAYAFGTQTWSISSQALWQHGLGELLLIGSLYLLARFGDSSRYAFLAGILCGLAVFNRPPNAFFALAIGGFYLLRGWRPLAAFASGGIGASLPFLVYNLAFFGLPLGGYQRLVGSDVFSHSIPDGVAAMLLSPGKGLLIYSPFLFFLVGAPLLKLGAAGRLPVILLWLAFAAQLVLYGTMDWRAGATYGPRFQTDVLPFLIVCLAPAVERIRRPLTLAVFVALVGFGVWVQSIGAFYFPAGGSYLLTQEQLWVRDGAQFLVEAKAGPARPEYLYRFAGWVRKVLQRDRSSEPLAAGKRSFFYTVAPCRILDTREPDGPLGGPALGAKTSRSFRLAGHCGVPTSAKAVSLNVTVTAAESRGSLTVYPADAPLPTASAVTYNRYQTRSSNGIFGLDARGDLAIYCGQDSGRAHVVVDVSGYFE